MEEIIEVVRLISQECLECTVEEMVSQISIFFPQERFSEGKVDQNVLPNTAKEIREGFTDFPKERISAQTDKQSIDGLGRQVVKEILERIMDSRQERISGAVKFCSPDLGRFAGAGHGTGRSGGLSVQTADVAAERWEQFVDLLAWQVVEILEEVRDTSEERILERNGERTVRVSVPHAVEGNLEVIVDIPRSAFPSARGAERRCARAHASDPGTDRRSCQSDAAGTHLRAPFLKAELENFRSQIGDFARQSHVDNW